MASQAMRNRRALRARQTMAMLATRILKKNQEGPVFFLPFQAIRYWTP